MLIFGAGGHAKVIIDCLLSQNIRVSGLIEEGSTKSEWHGFPVYGAYDAGLFPDQSAIMGIGSNETRKRLSAIVQHEFGRAIHRSAVVAPDAQIGCGTVIFHQAVVQASAALGDHAIVNTSASVDHDCAIGSFVHIAPGATLCGAVAVEEGTLIGAGATVVPNVKIGKWCTIGAGAVVVKDIPDYAVAVGNPARIIKYNQPK